MVICFTMVAQLRQISASRIAHAIGILEDDDDGDKIILRSMDRAEEAQFELTAITVRSSAPAVVAATTGAVPSDAAAASPEASASAAASGGTTPPEVVRAPSEDIPSSPRVQRVDTAIVNAILTSTTPDLAARLAVQTEHGHVSAILLQQRRSEVLKRVRQLIEEQKYSMTPEWIPCWTTDYDNVISADVPRTSLGALNRALPAADGASDKPADNANNPNAASGGAPKPADGSINPTVAVAVDMTPLLKEKRLFYFNTRSGESTWQTPAPILVDRVLRQLLL